MALGTIGRTLKYMHSRIRSGGGGEGYFCFDDVRGYPKPVWKVRGGGGMRQKKKVSESPGVASRPASNMSNFKTPPLNKS